jgi:hypothetical protein
MVLMPTYYSFGFDGGTEQTGNRLQALSISVGREFPEYSISPPYRDTQLGTRAPEFEITVGKPGRPGDFEVSDDPDRPGQEPGVDEDRPGRPTVGFRPIGVSDDPTTPRPIDDPVDPSFGTDPLGDLYTDQPDGPEGDRPDPPTTGGRGTVAIIPTRPTIDNGIDSGIDDDDQPPAGSVKTENGFVVPAISRVNFAYQLPGWLRDRSG